MLQVIQNYRTGELKVEEVPAPAAGDGGVLVRNRASLISPGTEKMIMDFAGKSLAGKAKERPDLVKQVIDKVRKEGLFSTIRKVKARLDQPMPLGYSSAGTVVEAGRGTGEFKVGDEVACAGMGYAGHAEYVFVPKNLCVHIPEGVNRDRAAFVTLGAIAMQGIRQASINVGETVVVIGLGLIGQLTAQIAMASGCRVIGIDVNPNRVKEAEELGLDAAVERKGDVKGAVDSFSGGKGADSIIITAATQSSDPIELAGELARDRAVVTAVGLVNLDVPRRIYYEKELELKLSRSYGPGRYDPQYEEKGIDYPYGYVRWTERRNMESFLELVGTGAVKVDGMITHRFDIKEAEKAYRLIGGDSDYLGILLEYGGEDKITKTLDLDTEKGVTSKGADLALIGAGNFAQGVLLPALKGVDGANLVAVSDIQGVIAKNTAEKYDCAYASSDYRTVMDDEKVNAVMIATRHNMHAPLAVEALEAGKHVFLEKPLVLKEEELDKLLEVWKKSGKILMVGFNRRFAPSVHFLKSKFDDIREPLCLNYRINAGYVPPESWLHDPDIGGGRIIGEVCHFVDLASFIAGGPPESLFAASLPSRGGVIGEDNIVVTLNFGGGSLASIQYMANGDDSISKERLEIFGGGAYGLLDDFRRALFSRGGRKEKHKSSSQDKGHRAELKAFTEALADGKQSPVSMKDGVTATLATFRILDSLGNARIQKINT